ncbi:MAG: sigma 54-interacting transcriptional regulator [Chromatiales bacterium]|nr:sigma 54-interacting transcriptional regulator [Chromatiales bacterium]
MLAKELIRRFLVYLRIASRADVVTLYVSELPGEPSATLLHYGSGSPVPELSDEEQAANFVREHGRSVGSDWFSLPSVRVGAYLVGVDIGALERHARAGEVVGTEAERRASDGEISDALGGDFHRLWLGLAYGENRPPAFFWNCPCSGALSDDDSSANWQTWSAMLGGYLAWGINHLSRSGSRSNFPLPGRAEFQLALEDGFDNLRGSEAQLALLMVNPDEFGTINRRLGQESGDVALREISVLLQQNLRKSDQCFRYGSAVFAVIISVSSRSAAKAAAENLRRSLSQHGYLSGSVRLAFSVGLTVDDGSEPVDSAEFVRRADQALNRAKLGGGGRTLLWEEHARDSGQGNLDRLSGIFTADSEKDYRNMLLLWDTITVVSSGADASIIAREFVDRVARTFKPDRVALFGEPDQPEPRLLAHSVYQANSGERNAEKPLPPLDDTAKGLIHEAVQHQRTERLRSGGESGKRASVAYAVPLMARGNSLACLYFDGSQNALHLDSSDLVFLDALSRQVATALDRSALVERWKQDKERESLQLRKEIKELRQVIQQPRLVYQSPQMQAVINTLRKVAPTDVTVLITGESGTGKERLAHTVHELSARSQMPFVTVDCGAIAHSLIDAELFGHTKGAFTGAQGASQGRIVQAEGGTLFLDEIGELPLDVQTKLLRFLQEKEVTPVGATRTIAVDARIVAATNRELLQEVKEGRFRADLYYRLQVVTVSAPPLRQRPDDILPLARYFLDRFSADYNKPPRQLDTAAEQALQGYAWPGNVRELQHRILQAVVMSESDLISQAELRLADQAAVSEPVQAAQVKAPVPMAVSQPDPAPQGAWQALREELIRQVEGALQPEKSPLPLGRWLSDDLVLTAADANDHVVSRGAGALGMAETTFRRRLDKVKRERQAGLLVRSADWAGVIPLLVDIVQDEAEPAAFDYAREVLLQQVLDRVHGNNGLGAALMGVTPATYRRWVEVLVQNGEPADSMTG